jgi:hypothetical protein
MSPNIGFEIKESMNHQLDSTREKEIQTVKTEPQREVDKRVSVLTHGRSAREITCVTHSGRNCSPECYQPATFESVLSSVELFHYTSLRERFSVGSVDVSTSRNSVPTAVTIDSKS